ncbi:hypothetical protein EXS65_03985 [Candidatus Peribacteria bacterium]|nr:hypothetical protein [Candidatus Peribacteria bacterium]
MLFDFFSKNGSVLPTAEAIIAVSNIEYAYGFGVYETIRVVHGKPVFLSEHLKRLMTSASAIELKHTLSETIIGEWIASLLTKISADTCNLKILLIGAKTPEDVQLFILPLAPKFPDKKLFRDGVSVITAEYERLLPNAKTLNMLPSYLFYKKAKEAGCYDALLIDRNGNITEGTGTNLLAIKGRTIISPPKENILEGVMRSNVLKIARENGYDVREEPIALKKINEYDGFFLTSTSSKILPISRIDDTVIKIPDTLKELMGYFDQYLNGIYDM